MWWCEEWASRRSMVKSVDSGIGGVDERERERERATDWW